MPRRPLTERELAEGRKAGVAARLQKQDIRLTFEQAFVEAAKQEGVDAASLRVKLVHELLKAALSGSARNAWALKLALEYLFGQPRAHVVLDNPAPVVRPEPVDIPPHLLSELLELQVRIREATNDHNGRELS